MNKDLTNKKHQTVYTQRTLLIVSSLLILAVAIWLIFDIVWGQVEDSFTLREEINQAKIEKQEQQNKLEKVKKIIQEFHSNQDMEDKLSVMLPSSTNYYQVLNELANNSNLSSVNISSANFREKTLISYLLGSNSYRKKHSSSSLEIIKPYTVIGFTVSGKGTYSQIKTFISLLEKDARLMDVQSFSMEKNKTNNQGQDLEENDPEINFQIKVDFYKQEK